MVLGLQQEFKEDGIEVSLVKLCENGLALPGAWPTNEPRRASPSCRSSLYARSKR